MSRRLRLVVRFVLVWAIVVAGNTVYSRLDRNYGISSAATILNGPAARSMPELGGWSGALPRSRRIVEDSDTETRMVNGQPIYTVCFYTPFDQSLHVSSYYHTLPRKQREATMRHELGHALMADLVNRGIGGGYLVSRDTTNSIQVLTPGGDESSLPEELRPIFEDYRKQVLAGNVGIYGADGQAGHAPRGYFLSNLGEYFAESWAQFIVDPGAVPPATRAAFELIETLD